MTSLDTVRLPDLSATAALGAHIAARLRIGDVVALTGPIGAGKTTLSRAILRALGHAGEVPSPTFTILESYAGGDMRVAAVHADFYRLESPAEAEELGLDEYRNDAALIAEWPENAGGFAHDPACLAITLEKDCDGGEQSRLAIVEAGGQWQTRWK
ncbi:MAG: tRNA (adenosine(37)-N6)-threonylcarbamoyltransferase complex ATPase subunit type 1 TsaE [Parerythrobacter sp.]